MPLFDVFNAIGAALDAASAAGSAAEYLADDKTAAALSDRHDDPELGVLRRQVEHGGWVADVALEDPPARALIKLRGDRNGVLPGSRRRALRLVEAWSQLARGPLAKKILAQSAVAPKAMDQGVRTGGGPYRSSAIHGRRSPDAADSVAVYRQHPISSLVVDVRSRSSRAVVRVRGVVRAITLDELGD